MANNVVVYKNSNKTIAKRVREHKHNFLKYWRTVRYWAKRKYNITDTDLEILLYLYDIELFTHGQFREFEGILAWDKKRFNDLKRKGHIIRWREHETSKQAALYTLSVNAKRICSSVYKKLTLEEPISEEPRNNPVFRGDSYADKVYRNAIRKMNEERERQEKEKRDKELGI